MDFIFMLTRGDMTVEDCLDVIELIRPVGLRHIGFKDMGVGPDTLRKLNDRIKAAGATSYMEVVSASHEAALNSASVAAEIGVDRLLGGTDAEAMLTVVAGRDIELYPFPGRPQGHPTRLRGTAQDIADDCRRFRALGCTGVDLLAYRATDVDPLELVAAARAALDGPLIVAGSVDSPERVRALARAGVDAFTVGAAAFNGSFSPRKGSLLSQLGDILATCADRPA